MTIKIIYSSGTVQEFFDRGKAEQVAKEQRDYGYSVTKDRDGDFFVDDEVDISEGTLGL